MSLRTKKTGPAEDTSSGPRHVWPTASPFPSSPPSTRTFPGPASSRVRARARSKEGGLTWRGNVQHWFCLEVGSGTGVPRGPTSRLLVLIGIASLLVPFGLSSNIYNDSTHPPRAMGGRVVGEPACQALCHPDSHSSEILGPQRRNMGTPLENPEPGSRHSLLQDSAASTWGWGWAESGNLVPRSGLLAPILDVFEVQSYLVSQNSGPGL